MRGPVLMPATTHIPATLTVSGLFIIRGNTAVAGPLTRQCPVSSPEDRMRRRGDDDDRKR